MFTIHKLPLTTKMTIIWKWWWCFLFFFSSCCFFKSARSVFSAAVVLQNSGLSYIKCLIIVLGSNPSNSITITISRILDKVWIDFSWFVYSCYCLQNSWFGLIFINSCVSSWFQLISANEKLVNDWSRNIKISPRLIERVTEYNLYPTK